MNLPAHRLAALLSVSLSSVQAQEAVAEVASREKELEAEAEAATRQVGNHRCNSRGPCWLLDSRVLVCERLGAGQETPIMTPPHNPHSATPPQLARASQSKELAAERDKLRSAAQAEDQTIQVGRGEGRCRVWVGVMLLGCAAKGDE